MRLAHTDERSASEPRYDAETVGKVAALAMRLQSRHEETLTAREIESIGAELGLEPSFVRQACASLSQQKASVVPRPPFSLSQRTLKGMAAAWWSIAWTFPFVLAILLRSLFRNPIVGAAFFPVGWVIYIGGGIVLSHIARKDEESPPHKLARAQLLEMLFGLQEELERQKQHRAFLSVDVVGSSEMKRQGTDLAVEYSFGQFRRWVEEIIHAEGGDMQSAAGDGVMCVFPANAGAVRAARRLQEDLAAFNATRNRLASPFRVRCGVSAGEVAIEEGVPLGHLQSRVIDRAAALQKQAEPGDILVGGELADVAHRELGTLSPLPEPVAGAPAFSWRAVGSESLKE